MITSFVLCYSNRKAFREIEYGRYGLIATPNRKVVSTTEIVSQRILRAMQNFVGGCPHTRSAAPPTSWLATPEPEKLPNHENPPVNGRFPVCVLGLLGSGQRLDTEPDPAINQTRRHNP